MQYDNTALLKKRLIGIGLGLLVIIVFFWALGKSTLTISGAAHGTGETVTYTLIDSKGKSSTFKSSDDTVTKRVSKDTYQVITEQSGTSYTAIVQTKNFLRKSEVVANMKSEYSRSFVGSNPGICMNYIGGQLISGECGADYASLVQHIPGTATSPQYVSQSPLSDIFGTSEGIVDLGGGTLAFAKSDLIDEGLGGHFAYPVGSDLRIGQAIHLSGIDAAKSYTFKSFKTGFVAYDSNMTDVLYFAAATAQPQRITISPPQDTKLKPHLISVSGDTLLILSDPQGPESATEDVNPKTGSGPITDVEVTTVHNGQQNHFTLKGSFRGAVSCGSEKICLHSTAHKLEVYDVSSGDAKHLYDIPGVNFIESAGSSPVLFTDKGVITYDTENQEGFYSYSFGPYKYCGYAATATGYLLCIGNDEMGKLALLLDSSGTANDNIDKKLPSFFKVPEISNASVYRQFIYMVPNYGQAQYDIFTHSSVYDHATVSRVNSKIAEIVRKAGIDTNKYTIVNTGQ